jgi:hypothetical protein
MVVPTAKEENNTMSTNDSGDHVVGYHNNIVSTNNQQHDEFQ